MKKIYALMIALLVMNGAMGQWFPQNSGTTDSLNSVYFTDANTGFAVGEDGIILKTVDGGTNWEPQNSGITNNLHSVFFNDSNTGYAVGDSGKILKTTNGGDLWSIQTSGIINDLNSVFFINTDTGYTVSSGIETGNIRTFHILKTTNAGALWNIIYSRLDTLGGTGGYLGTDPMSIYFSDKDTGYVVGRVMWMEGRYGFILKTINGGADWIQQSISGQGGYLESIYCINADTCFAVGSSYSVGLALIIKTFDGGTNWLPSTYGNYLTFRCALKSVYFTDACNGYAVGFNYFAINGPTGLIIKTTNGGIEWEQMLSGTSNGLNSVYFPSKDTGYVVGNYGTILKTTNGGGYPVGINDHHQTVNTLCIYPNPASTTITIQSPVKGSLYIHNTSDQQVLRQEVTEPTTTIDISTLPGGVYVVKVVGEKGVQVGKFIKE
jgi:photosystem II stability/assembly factor-like uncharacterized protein